MSKKIHLIVRTFKGWDVPLNVSVTCKIKVNEFYTRMTEFSNYVTCKRCKKIMKKEDAWIDKYNRTHEGKIILGKEK